MADAGAAEEETGLASEVAQLRARAEQAELEARENLETAWAYARSMKRQLELVHAFKARTVADMCAWHRSYHEQLAVERAANLELRERVSDMAMHAAEGARSLVDFRRDWDGTPAHLKQVLDGTVQRQLCRTWKRMAMPFLPDDD
jgi:hypothetical protein